jgi:hypothetical protein
MTTSYIVEKKAELKKLKNILRQAEKIALEKAEADALARKKSSDHRIAVKMARIEGREAPAAPAPEVVSLPEVEAAVGEPMVKSTPAKKAKAKKKSPSKKSPRKGS